MYKTLMLSLVLLTSAAWLQAQAYPQTAPTPATGDQTVQGCLQGSSGSYTLTDDNGTTYQLTGNTSDLSAHVGHQVEITGKTSGSSAPSGSSASSAPGASAAGGSTLDVKSMKHIAKTCKSAAK